MSDKTTDEREHCLRRLAALMVKTHNAQFYEFLEAGEYGLALEELTILFREECGYGR